MAWFAVGDYKRYENEVGGKRQQNQNIHPETFYGSGGEEMEMFVVDIPGLINLYQGRIYKIKRAEDAFDKDGNLKIELLQEFFSVPYPEFVSHRSCLTKTKNI